MSGKKSLFIARGEELNQKVMRNKGRGEEIAKDMLNHFKRFHSMNEIYDHDIEEQFLEEELEHIRNPKPLNFEKGLVTFSSSSVSKTNRELYFTAQNYPKDEKLFLPHHRRWDRPATAVHAAVESDLV